MFLTQLFKDPVAYATAVFLVILSIVLHELGHALAATWEGDPTPRLRGHMTWNPVVHMGWVAIGLLLLVGISFGRTPVNRSYFRHRRWGDVIVSFAGPAVNLFLAAVGALVLVAVMRFGGDGGDGSESAPRFLVEFWSRAVGLNVLLFLFNMIPLPPLDGFSVLDGTFDLGALGGWLRTAGFFPLVIAILVVNSAAFDAVETALARGLVQGAAFVLSPF